jgi:hypothetical protein
MPVTEWNYCWIMDSRSKRSVALNLNLDTGRQALLALVRRADVFVTNYQPALLGKFRLRYEDLQPSGTALDPSTEITVPSVYGGDESVKVLARWEDSKWSFNLVRFKYEPSFTLVAFSKQLNEEARVAIDEAVRLDRLEAPQKAMERRSNEDEAKRLLQEKARIANRPDFRP